MYVTAKGAMPVPVYFYADMVGCDETRFTAPDGTEVLLGIGADGSVVFAETEHSFVMINVRSGSDSADSEGAGVAITSAELESFAKGLNFASIDAAVHGESSN